MLTRTRSFAGVLLFASFFPMFTPGFALAGFWEDVVGWVGAAFGGEASPAPEGAKGTALPASRSGGSQGLGWKVPAATRIFIRRRIR
ncbi:MAG: hypothetical protein AAB578_06740, partial [Elusimicrobiota bacterium]